ncbi:hypothetical protein SAMN02745751_00875 [Dethiosulfatibacter aminovorans DSM 17477]|uniref:YlxR domain-containing protein n=1 Tax=Dethiosulfatibacter aminovorans DSM 17477 TaxID=1121476 RepID=A0A1M6DDV3_9FIRM|nr:YlxR family protein [Dethiosulfatibacter aminovorans]SHI71373.1 hypothetical protein SAMN02745751_00875 [Dethiosulfatibacter aminovorans DSM 17477]
MKNKKVPMRKCLGCNEVFPKKELIRVVKNKDGDIAIDLKGKMNGRGAYICKNKECYEKAYKTKRLNKAFQCEISEELYEEMLKVLEDDE